jgi:chaperone BCS1
MFEFVAGLYAQLVLAMKTYPWLAGAVSLWGLGVLTYCLKFIPTFIMFVKRQVLTSLEFNNAGHTGNETQFKAFMSWFLKSPYAKWSRYLSLDGNTGWYSDNDNNESYVVGAGYGKHFFFYNKRLFWFEKTSLNSQGSEKEKQHIVIKTFGRSQKPIMALIQDFAYKPKKDDMGIYTIAGEDWKYLTSVKKRPLSSVILKKEIKDKILENLEYFYSNPDWYTSRGLACKQTYILHGKPGTGKSSTIKAIASNFNKNICIIDLSTMSNKSFEKAMSTIPPNSIVLIEDFDSCSAVHDRETKAQSDNIFDMEMLSLSKILNVLDGVISLNGTIIFLTTNHLEKVDPAVVRKGRVDYIYEIPYLEDIEIKEYIKLMYPDANIPDITFSTKAGCDLQALFLECKDNAEEFISRLDTEAVS